MNASKTKIMIVNLYLVKDSGTRAINTGNCEAEISRIAVEKRSVTTNTHSME